MSRIGNPTSSQASAAAFHATTAAMATPNNVFKVNNLTAPERNQVRNVNFPVQMGSTDPDDVKYELQHKLVDRQGVVPNVGQAIVGPEYFDYVNRKMDVAEYAMFQDYLMKQANLDTPEASEYWYSKFPWMQEKRFEEIDRVNDLQKQMAKINITGPQNELDWMLLWNIDRGVVKIPNQPVHLLPQADYADGNDYKRGMFSPMIKYVPPFQAGKLIGNAGFQPNKIVTWASPSSAGTPFQQPYLRAPETIYPYAGPNRVR